MNESSVLDRRQKYRCEPAPVWAPLVSLISAGRRFSANKVVDVTLDGARLELSANDAAAFTQGQEVTASIQAPGLDGCADIRGRIVFRADHAGRNVLAIAFTETPDLSERSTAHFFSVFNRREDKRAASDPGADVVSAVLLNAEGEADAVIDLTLVDHSAKGVGFSVDPHTDRFIRDSDPAAVALSLPDQQDATRPAQLRRREARQDGVYYGCTFGAAPDQA